MTPLPFEHNSLLAGIDAALAHDDHDKEDDDADTAADRHLQQQGGYVLCLDDDVAPHPGTVSRLVDELEADDGAFMATGEVVVVVDVTMW